jgi:hypothetical protein
MTDDENTTVRILGRSSAGAESKLKPIIMEYKKRKSDDDDDDDDETVETDGDVKYSPGLADIQRLEGNVIHVSQKAAKALSKGVEVYEREREQSAREKMDGAIEDFIHNSAKATSAALKEASDIPMDLAESVNTESYRKNVRKTLKRASKFIRLWRI